MPLVFVPRTYTKGEGKVQGYYILQSTGTRRRITCGGSMKLSVKSSLDQPGNSQGYPSLSMTITPRTAEKHDSDPVNSIRWYY